MNNISFYSILITGVLVFLTGCAPFLIKDPSKYLTEQKNPIFVLPQLKTAEKSYGLKILADQVLGDEHGCKNIPESKNGGTDSQPKYYEDDKPLSSEMANAGTMKELMRSQCSPESDLNVGYSGMREFIDAMHKEHVRSFADKDVKEKISKAGDKLVFSKVLLTYTKAYYKGNFVLRDGTRLAKPSRSIGFNSEGVFSVSTDNDTLVGLTTVFLEALSEFAFPTPVLASTEKKLIYQETYRQKKKPDNTLFELFYTEKKVTDYLTDSNLQPTVQTLKDSFFENDMPLVPNKSQGISAIELKAMRHISSNVADGSKMVLGTTLRSVGGVGASFGGFAKLSIGDNDALTKIVETAIEVLSRRLLEYKLYQLFMAEPLESQLTPFFEE